MLRERDDEDRPPLAHEAIRPARKGNPRELVFAGRWRELMQSKHDALNRILSDYPAPIEQREASVAASFITWLGTNIGQAMLECAELRTAEKRHGAWTPSYAASDAHLGAWVAENRRKHGIDCGGRTLEAILADPATAQHAQPSAADYEVAEHVAFWLGQHDGQQFLSACQSEVQALARIDTYAGFWRCGCAHAQRAMEMRGSLVGWAAAGPVAAAALEALREAYGEAALSGECTSSAAG